jgi:hypothetical protein
MTPQHVADTLTFGVTDPHPSRKATASQRIGRTMEVDPTTVSVLLSRLEHARPQQSDVHHRHVH